MVFRFQIWVNNSVNAVVTIIASTHISFLSILNYAIEWIVQICNKKNGKCFISESKKRVVQSYLTRCFNYFWKSPRLLSDFLIVACMWIWLRIQRRKWLATKKKQQWTISIEFLHTSECNELNAHLIHATIMNGNEYNLRCKKRTFN